MAVEVEVGCDAAVTAERRSAPEPRLTSSNAPRTLWKRALRGRPPRCSHVAIVRLRVGVDDEQVEPSVLVVVEPAETAAHHRSHVERRCRSETRRGGSRARPAAATSVSRTPPNASAPPESRRRAGRGRRARRTTEPHDHVAAVLEGELERLSRAVPRSPTCSTAVGDRPYVSSVDGPFEHRDDDGRRLTLARLERDAACGRRGRRGRRSCLRLRRGSASTAPRARRRSRTACPRFVASPESVRLAMPRSATTSRAICSAVRPVELRGDARRPTTRHLGRAPASLERRQRVHRRPSAQEGRPARAARRTPPRRRAPSPPSSRCERPMVGTWTRAWSGAPAEEIRPGAHGADERERAEHGDLRRELGASGARSAAPRAGRPRRRRRAAPRAASGIVFGSVIMKKRKTRISGEVTSTHQKYAARDRAEVPARRHLVPARRRARRCRRRTRARSQTAIPSRCRRARIARPPATMSASASASQTDIGPHQNVERVGAVGAEERGSRATSPKFDGLKTCRPRNADHVLREQRRRRRSPAKIHQPCRLHQSPCSVPGTRRMKATPLPVSRALAGHMITRWRQKAIADLEHGAREQRDEDLRDREAEVERRLPEHLQRDDHGREVQPRVAERRQQHGIRACRGSAASACPATAERSSAPWYARQRRPELVERGRIGRQREHLGDERRPRAGTGAPGRGRGAGRGARRTRDRGPRRARRSRARRSAASRTCRPSPSAAGRGSGRSPRGRDERPPSMLAPGTVHTASGANSAAQREALLARERVEDPPHDRLVLSARRHGSAPTRRSAPRRAGAARR